MNSFRKNRRGHSWLAWAAVFALVMQLGVLPGWSHPAAQINPGIDQTSAEHLLCVPPQDVSKMPGRPLPSVPQHEDYSCDCCLVCQPQGSIKKFVSPDAVLFTGPALAAQTEFAILTADLMQTEPPNRHLPRAPPSGV